MSTPQLRVEELNVIVEFVRNLADREEIDASACYDCSAAIQLIQECLVTGFCVSDADIRIILRACNSIIKKFVFGSISCRGENAKQAVIRSYTSLTATLLHFKHLLDVSRTGAVSKEMAELLDIAASKPTGFSVATLGAILQFMTLIETVEVAWWQDCAKSICALVYHGYLRVFLHDDTSDLLTRARISSCFPQIDALRICLDTGETPELYQKLAATCVWALETLFSKLPASEMFAVLLESGCAAAVTASACADSVGVCRTAILQPSFLLSEGVSVAEYITKLCGSVQVSPHDDHDEKLAPVCKWLEMSLFSYDLHMLLCSPAITDVLALARTLTLLTSVLKPLVHKAANLLTHVNYGAPAPPSAVESLPTACKEQFDQVHLMLERLRRAYAERELNYWDILAPFSASFMTGPATLRQYGLDMWLHALNALNASQPTPHLQILKLIPPVDPPSTPTADTLQCWAGILCSTLTYTIVTGQTNGMQALQASPWFSTLPISSWQPDKMVTPVWEAAQTLRTVMAARAIKPKHYDGCVSKLMEASCGGPAESAVGVGMKRTRQQALDDHFYEEDGHL